MSIETKMRTSVFMRKLRTRLKTLQKKRLAAIKAYDVAVAKWRIAMVNWLKVDAPDRVRNITKTELKKHDHRWRGPGFDTTDFFHGAPKPPIYPSAKQVREIQTVLKQLAISEQSVVHFDTGEVKKYFEDVDEED